MPTARYDGRELLAMKTVPSRSHAAGKSADPVHDDTTIREEDPVR